MVITVLGEDRPGLVQTLSALLDEHQGNWKESRMVHMAGKFAGLLQVSVPAAKRESLMNELRRLHDEDNALRILVEGDGIAEQSKVSETLQVELLAPDAPGIIHNVTQQLVKLNVNIEELASEQRAAPMSNETLFHAALTLSLPSDVSTDEVLEALEGMDDQFMVDVV